VHRNGVWASLNNGVVDVLGSDHAPHTREEKAKTYPASPPGMTGVQTLVPIMLDHVNAGRLTLLRFVDLTSAGPARLFGIARKGRIAVGYDADLTVVDLKRRQTITDKWVASRAGWTPYDGVAVTGWPVGTIVRGRKVMWDGSLATPAQGDACAFWKLWRARDSKLLPLLDREFTVANAVAETVGEFGGRFFTICGDEFGKSCEQAGLRQAIAVNSVVTRLGPGLLQVAECHALLVAIGNRLA
jgi:Dihydroorotase and related cyclic amidohydrolases